MQLGNIKKQIDPMLSFHLMKFAFQDYQKSVGCLTKHEYSKAYQHANEEMLLHRVILNSDDACYIVVPEALQRQTLHDVIAEYPSKKHFYATLRENNISIADYAIALHNDLRVETVLARVACNIQSITQTEMLHYFNKNITKFHQPEQRSASHMQITYDPLLPIEKDSALQKITTLHQKVRNNPETFKQEARRFSHCNTEANGGALGKLAAGELCHELDKALFSLAPGEISPVIGSSQTFNILQCTQIHPETNTSFRESSPALFAILLKKKQLNACRLWLQNLVKTPN